MTEATLDFSEIALEVIYFKVVVFLPRLFLFEGKEKPLVPAVGVVAEAGDG